MNKEEMNLMWKVMEKRENEEELSQEEKKLVLITLIRKSASQVKQVGDIAKTYGYIEVENELSKTIEIYRKIVESLEGE